MQPPDTTAVYCISHISYCILYVAYFILHIARVLHISVESSHLQAVSGHISVYTGHLEVVKALTSVVNNKNPKDAYDVTPLHLASHYSHLSIVEHLVKFVPDINIKTLHYWNKRAPLHYASMEGHLEVVKLLLKSGANPDLKTSNNMTPLGIALKNKHSDLANYLKNYMNYAKCEHHCTKFPDDCQIIGKYHLLINQGCL